MFARRVKGESGEVGRVGAGFGGRVGVEVEVGGVIESEQHPPSHLP